MRTRRVLRRMAAPILSNRTRMVAEVAAASSVPAKAISRKRCMSVYASAESRLRSQLVRNFWLLAREKWPRLVGQDLGFLK